MTVVDYGRCRRGPGSHVSAAAHGSVSCQVPWDFSSPSVGIGVPCRFSVSVPTDCDLVNFASGSRIWRHERVDMVG